MKKSPCVAYDFNYINCLGSVKKKPDNCNVQWLNANIKITLTNDWKILFLVLPMLTINFHDKMIKQHNDKKMHLTA